MAHTPGPWKAEKTKDKLRGTDIKLGCQDIVCEKGMVASGVWSTDNATLIAAAPDLLAACEAALALAKLYRSMCVKYTKTIPPGLLEDLESIEATINKAKGV